MGATAGITLSTPILETFLTSDPGKWPVESFRFDRRRFSKESGKRGSFERGGNDKISAQEGVLPRPSD